MFVSWVFNTDFVHLKDNIQWVKCSKRQTSKSDYCMKVNWKRFLQILLSKYILSASTWREALKDWPRAIRSFSAWESLFLFWQDVGRKMVTGDASQMLWHHTQRPNVSLFLICLTLPLAWPQQAWLKRNAKPLAIYILWLSSLWAYGQWTNAHFHPQACCYFARSCLLFPDKQRRVKDREKQSSLKPSAVVLATAVTA